MSDMPTLIEYASFFGSIKIFKFLLMQNAKIDENIWGYAVHGQNYDIIHMIEDKHIEPFYCVQSAIRYYRYDLFEYFTDAQNIKINRDCINRAILNFNLPVLIDRDLLGSLYDKPNLTSGLKGDWNPLICSALKSYPIITELLLLIPKIDTNIVYSIEKTTPLIISVRNYCFENVKLLCNHQVTDINLTILNRNAFCMAAAVGDVRILHYLINLNGNSKLKKLSINFDSYVNPFFWAISSLNLHIVKILFNDQFINQKIASSKARVFSEAALLSVRVKFWSCYKFLIQSQSDQDFEAFSQLLFSHLPSIDENNYAKKLLKEEIERRK